MVLTYYICSSILFCFAMSFLFSLCIVGSPFLKDVTDQTEYVRRFRMLLTVALVNGIYIATGFLLNFKEIAKIFYNCCDINEPYSSKIIDGRASKMPNIKILSRPQHVDLRDLELRAAHQRAGVPAAGRAGLLLALPVV